MTDPPSDDGRTARSDAASRLAALLSDVVGTSAPAPAPAPPPVDPGAGAPPREETPADEGPVAGEAPADESPIDEGATGEGAIGEGAIDEGATGEVAAAGPSVDVPPSTDEDAEEAADATDAPGAEDRDGPVDEPAPRSAPAAAPPPAAPVRVAEEAPDEAGAEEVDEPGAEAVDDGRPLSRVTLRAVAFGTALALLVAAVPALGWVGKERLLRSRGGEVVEGTTDPSEPGYRALVAPTSTGLVVHRDAEGDPVSATVLALGAGEAGGTVLQVPLTTQVHEPFMIRRLIGIWEEDRDDERFRRHVEEILGVAVPGPVIDLTDESLASLVQPVAPLELVGTDPVVTDDGREYSGDIVLEADEVGPYLRAGREDEPELARLARAEKVWEAWLAELGQVGVDEGVGAATTGIGPFLRVLAAGTPAVTTLDVVPDEPAYFGDIPPLVPTETFDQQIADAVPFPQTPSPGRRTTVKLLNGAEGATLPMDLMHELVAAGTALVTLGNADDLGQATTLVEYGGSSRRDEAEDLAELLGNDVEIDQMSDQRAEAEAEDVVITIGSDVLERYGDGG